MPERKIGYDSGARIQEGKPETKESGLHELATIYEEFQRAHNKVDDHLSRLGVEGEILSAGLVSPVGKMRDLVLALLSANMTEFMTARNELPKNQIPE